MTIESQIDIDALRRVGAIVSSVLTKMLDRIEPGMTTAELDEFGRQLLSESGARSAPQVMYQFPGATCISVNEEAAHGIPGARRINPGDLVNVDVSAEFDGYFADTGGTRIVAPATPLKSRLCHATRMALDAAINEARAGNRINQIGKAIERTAKAHGFKTIKNLAGHGVGRSLHEDPKDIVSFYDLADRRVLHEGMVIAIEPFLSTKTTIVSETGDGWTLAAAQGNWSAQYEHTIIVTRGAPIIVTTH
ncbi:MAG TPA: type I methionyl aminopeptidase [Steroidobacteraceae bacterium]|nr:type I methionyl aminopeptidase [Steroidobacteraceae bacterium]